MGPAFLLLGTWTWDTKARVSRVACRVCYSHLTAHTPIHTQLRVKWPTKPQIGDRNKTQGTGHKAGGISGGLIQALYVVGCGLLRLGL
jgi:hypothetical protein